MKLSKINQLNNGNQLFVFFSNNKGRGRNNCTIQVVPKNETRKRYSRNTCNIIAQITTSSWKGDINLSQDVQNSLGIAKDMILM